MVVLSVFLLRPGEVAVETYNVSSSGLDPDAAIETALGGLAWARGYVENGGRSIAKKIISHVAEEIVLTIEIPRVHQQHLDKTGLIEVEMQAAAQACNERSRLLEEANLLARSRGLVDVVRLVADDLVEVDATKEVLVGVRNLAQDGVGPHVLNVGLNQRSPLPDRRDDDLLASDGLVNQRILAGRKLTRWKDVILCVLLLAADVWKAHTGVSGKGGCDKEGQ